MNNLERAIEIFNMEAQIGVPRMRAPVQPSGVGTRPAHSSSVGTRPATAAADKKKKSKKKAKQPSSEESS